MPWNYSSEAPTLKTFTEAGTFGLAGTAGPDASASSAIPVRPVALETVLPSVMGWSFHYPCFCGSPVPNSSLGRWVLDQVHVPAPAVREQ